MTERPSERPEAGPALNPWWGVWVQPRLTIRQILKEDPKQHFWVLVVFYGIIRGVTYCIQVALGDHLSPAGVGMFILAVGPIVGILGVYFSAALLGLLGRLVGGKPDSQAVRAVLAWASMPMSVLVVISLFPFIMMFGQDVFSTSNPVVQRVMFGTGAGGGTAIDNFLGNGLMMWRVMLELIGNGYYIVIAIVGLAEAQGLRLWRAAGVFFIVMGGLLLLALSFAVAGAVA